MTNAGKALVLISAASAGGCATLDGPAWYCSGNAIVDGVQGISTQGLNADGTSNYVSREWDWPPLPNDRMILLITGSRDEFRIGVMRAPKGYFKEVNRVEIRLGSADNPQHDPSLARDDVLNRGNGYVFGQQAVAQHKNEPAYFVALNRAGQVWWVVPLDLSMIDRGEKAIALADVQLSTKRADFSKLCLPRSKADVVIA